KRKQLCLTARLQSAPSASTPAGSSSVSPFRTSHVPAAVEPCLMAEMCTVLWDMPFTLMAGLAAHTHGAELGTQTLLLHHHPKPAFPPCPCWLHCCAVLVESCPSLGDCLLLTEPICMLSHFSTFQHLSKKMHIFSCFISAQRQIFLEYLPFSKVLCFLIMLSPHLTCPIQMISTLSFTNTHISKQSFIVKSCQLILRNKHLQSCSGLELDNAHNMNFSFLLQSILLSASIKREGDSPTASPHSSDDIHHSDRYQTFLRVRANRQTRLNARIGKMKRRKQDEGQREGSCMTEDDSVDIENENGNRFEEYEWCGQKRIRATTLLEGGFRGSGFIMCSGKENPDSDADLDVDGDDTLEYGKPQYTEADIIPCTGEEPGEAKEREALRGAVLNGGTPSTRITPEFSKWASDEMPSTSNGESSKQETMQKTCKNSDIEKITEDSAVTTFEALKARVRELERQLSRGDRYKCLICMDSYTMPLTSIQCWHVHCEECWLRTLGAKKLCPQCNTITSPGDLRRIYL
ncbi:RN220 ligase, partial [Motacilla alba]|nr:RN220 ligase [Motacilla alba]